MLKKYHPIWVILITTVSAFLIWYFRVVLLYLFFAMCLTFVLTPIVKFFSRGKYLKVKIPRLYSTIFAFLILFGVIALFFSTVFPLINNEIVHIRNVDPNKVTNVFDQQIYYFESLMINNHMTTQQPGFLKPFIIEELNNLLSKQNASLFVSNLLNGLTVGFIALFSVLFITFFSLKDENLLKKSIANIIPGKYYVDYINVFNNIETLLSRYFLGLLIQASLISIIVTICLLILGVNNALLIGILVGLINVIPYIGQVISIFVALALGIASNIDIIGSSELLFFILKITGIVVATQTLDSFIFQPLIFSKSVKAHPLEIFLMVFIGGTIAGAFGMFLAIPVYTIIKVTYIGIYRAYLKRKAKESIQS